MDIVTITLFSLFPLIPPFYFSFPINPANGYMLQVALKQGKGSEWRVLTEKYGEDEKAKLCLFTSC